MRQFFGKEVKMVENPRFTEEIVTKTIEIAPCERLLIDVVKILGPVSSRGRLAEILFIAQECGAVAGEEDEIYEFSALGPEMFRPASNLFDLHLFRLRYNEVFVQEGDRIVGHWGEESLPDEELAKPTGAVKSPRVLRQIAQVEPKRLASMARVAFVDKYYEEREGTLERAKSSFFMSNEDANDLLAEFDRLARRVERELAYQGWELRVAMVRGPESERMCDGCGDILEAGKKVIVIERGTERLISHSEACRKKVSEEIGIPFEMLPEEMLTKESRKEYEELVKGEG